LMSNEPLCIDQFRSCEKNFFLLVQTESSAFNQNTSKTPGNACDSFHEVLQRRPFWN